MNTALGPTHDPAWLAHLLDDPGRLHAVPAGPLSLALLDNLASSDPHLRDALSLTLLDRLIESDRLATPDRERLAAAAIDEAHLGAGLGHTGDDRVFARSFGVLVVAALVEHDRDRQELVASTVGRLADAVLTYAACERDFRGYIPGQGWAHAAAHTADALGCLAAHPAVPASMVPVILQRIRELASVPVPLGFLEDDRLALAAYRIMRLGKVPDDAVTTWLGGFNLPPDETDAGSGTVMGSNQEHFLRSLYFRWLRADALSPWLSRIQTAVARFDCYGAAVQDD